MQSIFEETSPERTDAKDVWIARPWLFALLVLAAAAIGAAGGLLLVFTVDLPQVDELEHYRPSSITQLYDDHNRAIGSFALQHRVIASYDDYPQVLRDALLSIEDKDFYRHWGVNVWRIA